MITKEITLKVTFNDPGSVSIGNVHYGESTMIARFFKDILHQKKLINWEEQQDKHEFIDKVTTENTGGYIMVDFVHLKDGRVLGISDEIIVLYPSHQAFLNDDFEDSWQTIDLLK